MVKGLENILRGIFHSVKGCHAAAEGNVLRPPCVQVSLGWKRPDLILAGGSTILSYFLFFNQGESSVTCSLATRHRGTGSYYTQLPPCSSRCSVALGCELGSLGVCLRGVEFTLRIRNCPNKVI